MVFITSPSSRSPTRHWQNMHGTSNAAWAALPNPLCQNCSTELLITPNAYMVGFCHFIRRQTCREVKRIHSGLTEAGFWVLLALFETLRVRKKNIFFLWRCWQLPYTLPGAAGAAGSSTRRAARRGRALSSRESFVVAPACSAWLAHAGHPAVGQLNLFTRKKIMRCKAVN